MIRYYSAMGARITIEPSYENPNTGITNMSHEVYENDKVAYVEGSDVPWHNVNCVTFKPDDSIEKQWENTSLNYELECEPLQIVSDGRVVTHRAVVRKDNRDVMGIVGPQWEPYQPRQVMEALSALVSDGILQLHTAGSLKNGRRMWAQCTIVGHQSEFEVLPNDFIRQYYTIAQGFDGLLGVHAGFNRIRTVCNNTLQAALSDKFSRFVRIKHNRLVADNVRELIASIDWETQELKTTLEKYQFLAKHGCNRNDLRNYVRIVLQIHPDTEWDKLPTRSKNTVARVERLFDTGIGNDSREASGTWWAGYNAVTQYLSHEHGRNADNRLDNLWFGTGRATLERALEHAISFAELSSVA